jgi:hypothetical protein
MPSPQQLQDTVADHHLPAIQHIVDAAKGAPVSPERVRHHCKLCDSDGAIIYSTHAIQQAMDLLQSRVPRDRPTAENRAKRPTTGVLDVNGGPRLSTPPYPSGTPVAQPSSTKEIRVQLDEEFITLRVSPSVTFEHFLHHVHTAFQCSPDARLRVGHETAAGWNIIYNDESLATALQDHICAFQIRTGMSSHAARSPSPGGSTAPPVQLSFELSEQTQNRKNWEFRVKVREDMKKRVAEKLGQEGTAVGSPLVSSSISALRAFLRQLTVLNANWEVIDAEQAHQHDGLDLNDRLHWYIAAVIDHFHPAIAQVWHSNDPGTSAKRQPHSFASFPAFLAQLYVTVKPGTSGSPLYVLPAMLEDLKARLPSFTWRRDIGSELNQVLTAVQFLQAQVFPDTADHGKHITLFLEQVLAPDVQTRLREILKQHHADDLPPIFRDSDDYAQLQSYRLASVLRRWQAFDTSSQALKLAEFQGWTTRASGMSKSSDTNRPPARGTSGVALATTPPEPSDKLIRVSGIEFRQNLASWADQTDRQREEAKFVELVYNFEGQCHHCHRQGHRQVGCPDLFQLDSKGQDRNPKSYFYQLIPPPVALDAGKHSGHRAVGRGSSPGDIRGSRGGGRASRGGSDRVALAAVLEATTRLETQMELLSREQHRDHARMEQVAQQLGEQMGNGKAGAAQ